MNRGVAARAVTVVVNAVSARRGGGLMVYRALLSEPQAYGRIRFVVIVNGETAYEELAALGTSVVTLVRVPAALRSLAVYLQRFIVNRVVRKYEAVAVINQNFFVEGCVVPQIVLHVNVFSFVDNPNLRGWAQLKEHLRQRAARIALARAAANVFESHHLRLLAESTSAFDATTAHVLHIGIETISSPTDKVIVDCSQFQVAVVTSDNPHKRNELLADVALAIHRLLPESTVNLTVFGGGSFELLRARAGTLGVSHMFSFRGYVSSVRLGEELVDSLCLITTSEFESFCSVAVEAMARGVPAIVPATSAMPESVGSAGVVVPESDLVEGMAEEVYRLCTDPQYRAERVRSGLLHAESLSWTDAIKHLSGIIDETLARVALQASEESR